MVSSALDSSPPCSSGRNQAKPVDAVPRLIVDTRHSNTRVGSLRFSVESENNLNINTRRKWKFNLSFLWKQKVVLFNLYQLKLFSVEFKPLQS